MRRAGEFSTLGELGQKLQILETVAEWLSEDFVWKNPISLEMQECGSARRPMDSEDEENRRLLRTHS